MEQAFKMVTIDAAWTLEIVVFSFLAVRMKPAAVLVASSKTCRESGARLNLTLPA